jgi:ornithine cyclodeaminase|tara:strand:- start:402 stop:1334 length:933 start_codon:yes stop_codon:yes gene_type:complete
MQIISLERIKSILPKVDLISEIEAGFAAYSNGLVVVPPVGELSFQSPPGDVHIKYGYIKGDEIYVIKIASGFYKNTSIGLPAGNGMMLVFNQKTGQPVAILQDECYLTDIRTAVAGAITAKYLSPKNVEYIGIVGTGIQARLQLRYLKEIIDCNNVITWGRSPDSLSSYKEAMSRYGYQITTTANINDVIDRCQLIITCTPSEEAIIDKINPGTHITAMGSDTVSKRELSSNVLLQADMVVTDSRAQSKERGEIYQASKDGFSINDTLELGEIISGASKGRTDQEQITIADLTGVAVQDIQISKAILENL